MLKKFFILICCVFTISTNPVFAQTKDDLSSKIIVLIEVEPLKVDSNFKQAKFILEDGSIFKRKALIVDVKKDDKLTSKSSKTIDVPVVIKPKIEKQPESKKVDLPDIKKWTEAEIKNFITKYSQKYDVDADTMLRIAECESEYKADLVASNKYYGVYQFSKSTFDIFAPELNLSNPDPLNPEQNIELAVYLYGQGQGWRWGCK